MKDINETNLPNEDAGKLEELNAPETAPDQSTREVEAKEIAETETGETVAVEVKDAMETTNATETEVTEVAEAGAGTSAVKLTKEEVIERLDTAVNQSSEMTRSDLDLLKQSYYKIRRNEVEELKKAFMEEGGAEADFVAPEDENENKLKQLLSIYREKRAAAVVEDGKLREANYALKLQLIDQLKALIESQDDFNKLYNNFKDIQARWKEAKAVPQEHANELWKNYQIYSEKFYDLIKINNQFRDYDFKKNLEIKNALCETVEKLEGETDVVSAFHQLQKLHQQWRETGPVAKEIREEVWGRFKKASTAINKKHQDHFEGLKAKEQDNLQEKTAICEQIEAMDFSTLSSFKEWEEKSKEVIALQSQWKTIGFAPKKSNVKIFERFRSACDSFFNQKSEYYKSVKGDMEKNLDLKKALCEKAEALKDSDDWKNTTDKMIALQKEWKSVGPVARKHSEIVWKRFISACDYFFEQKNKNFSSQKGTEQVNLAAKKEIIGKINALEESNDDDALTILKSLMAEWNTIGHVPFKEKDKVYKEYREAADKQFDRLKIDMNDRRMQSYRSNLSDLAGGERGKGKLYDEREKLMRIYDRMKSELQTYENNIGFLSVSSKGGGGLVKEMERKIEKLKNDMALTVKKISAIDENLE